MKGRNKLFDESEVLNAAREVFWAKGYYATSTRDLASAMNISYSSVYHSFNSKEELLLKVLEDTKEVLRKRFSDIIEREDNPLDGLKILFKSFATELDTPSLSKGCLIGNLYIEIDPRKQDIYELIGKGLNQMRAVFYEALLKAQKLGYLSSKCDIDLMSLNLLNFYEGLMIMRKSKINKNELLKLVELNLNFLK